MNTKERAQQAAINFDLTSIQALILEGIFNDIYHSGWMDGFKKAQGIAEGVFEDNSCDDCHNTGIIEKNIGGADVEVHCHCSKEFNQPKTETS